MRGRGVISVPVSVVRRAAAVLCLTLILGWPALGFRPSGGAHREAISLAVDVDASAAFVVGASLEGRP